MRLLFLALVLAASPAFAALNVGAAVLGVQGARDALSTVLLAMIAVGAVQYGLIRVQKALGIDRESVRARRRESRAEERAYRREAERENRRAWREHVRNGGR